MARCLQCSSAINENEQYYVAGDLGPEIISVLERNLGRQVDDDGALCSRCFDNTLNGVSDRLLNDVSLEDYELQERHDSNVCIWCRNSLYERNAHPVPEGPQMQLIAEAISPRVVPQGSSVCADCWLQTQRTLQQRGVIPAPPVNRNICVWCSRSLARCRRHSIPEGPERNEITARIYPREIPLGGLVCYACWQSARRTVQRAANVDAIRNPEASLHRDSICAWCRMSLHRRPTHRLPRNGPIRDVVAARIHPNELQDHELVCRNCWRLAQENVQIEQGLLIQERQNETDVTMTFNEFTHTSSSLAACFVPECTNRERNLVPEYLRNLILRTQKVFVTDNTRICNEHKVIYNWDFLDQHQFSNTFTKNEIESMLGLLVKESEVNQFDFEHIENIEDNFFKFWTGVTKNNFNIIFNQISPALTCKNPKTALGVYLIKLRSGESHEKIASLLHLSKSSITRLLTAARHALINLFVPLHLGNMSREELINRNLLIPEGLFGNREERVPIVICDGTYIYVEKSSNYLYQKKTYSLHKYRNLVKPFLIVATDGYIVDVLGPYAATTSDSDIMKSLFQSENSNLRAFFQANDVFILDRGFRDAIPMLEELGFKVHRPEGLDRGEHQLPTNKANKTRCVTLCRWVVEVVNGRFKRDFKLLRQNYFNLAATHLMDDVRICAALINAFHPVIVNRPDANKILTRALQRRYMPNQLAELVISNRINRHRAQFSEINGQLPELNIFPEMTMSDLILFALGTYQIKQARSYYGEHIRQHGSFQVEISSHPEVVTAAISPHLDPVLIRGRIKSRHQSGRVYYTYILLATEGSRWDDKILQYYCSCVSGQRTVGCCAHIMTIVWYLGWARYQESIEAPASFLDGILVRDDVDEEEEQ